MLIPYVLVLFVNLNGDGYTVIPLNTDDKMTIGFIKKEYALSRLGKSILRNSRNIRTKYYKESRINEKSLVIVYSMLALVLVIAFVGGGT